MKTYYQDDSVTIYHGDSREIVPQLGNFDLLLTDPPYGLGKKLCGGTWGTKCNGGLDWDKAPAQLVEFSSSANEAIIWGGNYFVLPPSRCWLIWRKPDAVRTMADCDMAWTSFDAPARVLTYSIAATNRERNGHPTQKPVELMRWCLSFAPQAQTILDPFAGSGTTGRAAKDLGRKATLIELEEKYCEIAAKRMQQEVLQFT